MTSLAVTSPGFRRSLRSGSHTARKRRFSRLLTAAFFFLPSTHPALHAQDAAALRRHAGSLRLPVAKNAFQRPLHLDSSDAEGTLRGDIHSLLDTPFASVGPALQGMDHWCEMLSLHMNVKGCMSSRPPEPDTLTVDIGRKFDQPLADAYRFAFRYRVVASTPDYVQVTLDAATGPLGTHDYRILLEAVAIDARHSLMHMSYAYGYGVSARVAMNVYLATIGSAKVGFTVTGSNTDGTPVYVAGTLGVIERNTMRYYLATEAYLAALPLPEAERREHSLRAWYDAVERYPAQLHELSREDYLAMKHNEHARQQGRKQGAQPDAAPRATP